jgi:hypothetical protein
LSPRSKRHHIVPQFILKNFCDQNGQLYFYQKNRPHKGIEVRNPETAFFQRNIYSNFKSCFADQREDKTEQHFAQIESAASPVIKRIIESARNTKLPSLNEEEKYALSHFIRMQFARTPCFYESLDLYQNFESGLNDFLNEYPKELGRELNPSELLEKQRLLEPDNKNRLKQNVISKAFRATNQPSISILSQSSLRIIMPANKNLQFVIGDRAVLKFISPSSTKLGDKGVGFWLPISKDIGLHLTPHKHKESLERLSTQTIQELNTLMVKESRMVAASSKERVQAYLDV